MSLEPVEVGRIPRSCPANAKKSDHRCQIRRRRIPLSETTLPAAPVELAPVLELAPFDRFVFVLSVLERYADHDCSLLLGCSRRDVLAARARGLQQIASAVESHREQQINTGSENPVLHDDHSPVFELQTSH